jgi:hypothetical protein
LNRNYSDLLVLSLLVISWAIPSSSITASLLLAPQLLPFCLLWNLSPSNRFPRSFWETFLQTLFMLWINFKIQFRNRISSHIFPTWFLRSFSGYTSESPTLLDP